MLPDNLNFLGTLLAKKPLVAKVYQEEFSRHYEKLEVSFATLVIINWIYSNKRFSKNTQVAIGPQNLMTMDLANLL